MDPNDEQRKAELDELFNHELDRTPYHTVKHTFCPDGVLPMWVADMDLAVSPAIMDAIQQRARHPCFGYTIQPPELWNAVAQWLQEQHNWRLQQDDFVFTSNLVTSTVNGLHAFTEPGDAVAVITPLYSPLQHAVKGTGRRLVKVAGTPERPDGQMELNMTDLRMTLEAECVKLLIWCSPHNPFGRVWSHAELLAVADICRQLGIFIISDEIHADLTLWGLKHTPMALICQEIEYDRVMITSSPGKTWNLAGLHCGFVVLQSPVYRQQYLSIVEHAYLHFGSTFATVGMIAAYRNGKQWRDCVCHYIEDQILFTEQFLNKRVPEIKVVRPQASFLIFLNCAGLGMDAVHGGQESDLCVFMQAKARVKLSDGWSFGGERTAHYQRINVACPRAVLVEALERVANAVAEYVKTNHSKL